MMPGMIKAMLRCLFCRCDHKQTVVETAKSLSLQDFTASFDFVDTRLFTENFDWWFARVIYEFQFAMAIYDGDLLGHSRINPKDVLEQMEASYRRKFGKAIGVDGSIYHSEVELFKRINAARDTKDKKTFQTFLDQLSSSIKSLCQQMPREGVIELDAGLTSHHVHCSAPPRRTASSGSSSGESTIAVSTADDPASSSQEDVAQKSIPASPNSLPPSTTVREDLPLAQFTSLICQYAIQSGKKINFDTRRKSDTDMFRCEVSLDGQLGGVGEAMSKKEAKHIASRSICHAIGITNA